MNKTIFTNASIVDGVDDRAREGFSILVADGRIQKVSESQIHETGAETIDLRGKTIMPGLIDAHVHVVSTRIADLHGQAMLPDSLVAAHSFGIMRDMLMRGFTTVRDLGGADLGLVQAVEEGLADGPRLVICGKALSQTGGHTDFRGAYNNNDVSFYARKLGVIGRVCDGVENVRLACREELKAGASFIKMMANGGVASPSDPLTYMGFSREEILAAVQEAENADTYVAAHVYTDKSIRRALELGVHSFEHCNLIEEDTAKLMASLGGIACPTITIFETLVSEGAQQGLPPENIEKAKIVLASAYDSLARLKSAGVRMAYGTDLSGAMHRNQSEEFIYRSRGLSKQDAIRSATADAAVLLRKQEEIGSIKEGLRADLIVVDGNPLEDITLLTKQGAHLAAIMKDGRFVKRASL